MRQFFRLFASLCIALGILGALSFFMEKYQILDPIQQAKIKEGKTFWDWHPIQEMTSSIHYIEKGSGFEHVLLIHGFRANSYSWHYLIKPLEEAGFHVWAIDLIGFGLSDKPDLEYDFDLFLQQITDFMRDKNIAHAHLIGGSMGGGLCLGVALLHPESVHSVTLINALAYPLDIPLYATIGKILSPLWGLFFGPNMIQKGLEQLVYSKETVTEEQVKEYTLPYYLPGGNSAAQSTLRNFDNQKLLTLSRQFKNIQCPLLILWGRHDNLIPFAHYESFCRDFPLANKVLIEECGHIPHEEKPKEVLNAILSFLKANNQT